MSVNNTLAFPYQISGSYRFLNLPPASSVPLGTAVSTIDQGTQYSNGQTWQSTPPVVALTSGISVNTTSFGADPTGVNDSTAAIQAAINTVQALNGGTVYIPQGTYLIGTSGAGLLVSTSNVQLVGAGASNFIDSGSGDVPATTFLWGGASSLTAAILAISSPAGATLNALTGCNVSGIRFNCNSLAGIGLLLTSVKKCRFSQLYVQNPITAAYKLTTLANGQLVGTDLQHCIFDQLSWRCLDSVASKKAHGIWCTSANLASAAQGNESFNIFNDCYGQNDGGVSSGNGVRVDAGDNNIFNSLTCYRVSSTVPAVLLQGNNSSSDGNYFFRFSDTVATNAIQVTGNATLGSGFNPVSNTFYGADQLNSVAYPTLDAGCRIFWQDSSGAMAKLVTLGRIAGQFGNEAAALAQVANLGSYSDLIINGSNAHQLLTDGTNSWGIVIDGSGNLRFNAVAGSGLMSVLQAIQATGYLRANFATAIPAGGNTGQGVALSSAVNFGIYYGSGLPTISAAQGSLYLRSDGSSTSTRLYINTNGSTGWTNVVTAT